MTKRKTVLSKARTKAMRKYAAESPYRKRILAYKLVKRQRSKS